MEAQLMLITSVVLPHVAQLIWSYYIKVPYHTSILTDYGWIMELLNGHPKHIWTELGMHKEVFLDLVDELHSMGYSNSRSVTLEEQLAIYLYTCVTGLTVQHVGERFQRANETVS